MQEHFELIPHVVDKEIIQQRVKDGYINATEMCKAASRPWSRYWEARPSKDFAAALSSDLGISITELIQSVTGGNPKLQGTWVHPQVAIHLAQWLSPEFAVKVSRWVYEWMSGHSRPGPLSLPYHLQRYMINNDKVPSGYFSILAELSIILIAPLEHMGYRLPPEMVPDISSGRIFCKWLRDDKGIDTDTLPTYFHRYPDGRVVPAKLYPETLLADFRKHVREVWLREHSVEYFRKRDGDALQYLPRLIAITKAPPVPLPGSFPTRTPPAPRHHTTLR
jgi:hypothetical protein